jgi:hypothetical protein
VLSFNFAKKLLAGMLAAALVDNNKASEAIFTSTLAGTLQQNINFQRKKTLYQTQRHYTFLFCTFSALYYLTTDFYNLTIKLESVVINYVNNLVTKRVLSVFVYKAFIFQPILIKFIALCSLYTFLYVVYQQISLALIGSKI